MARASVARTGISLIELKAAYDRGENIMRLLREHRGETENNQLSILLAYDLQAGSYVAALESPTVREAHTRYVRSIAAVLDDLRPKSLLDAGCGEATTLTSVLREMRYPPARVLGFDL